MLESIKAFLWGPYTVVFLVILCLIILLQTKFRILRPRILFGRTFGEIKNNPDAFGSMCLSLGGTIGVGNTISIAGALRDGGPYTLIWMGVAGIVGMTVKFAEVYFTMKYTSKNKFGSISYISRVFHSKIIGALFAISAIAVSYGMGNLSQAKTAASAFSSGVYHTELFVSVVLAILFFIIVFKGIESIKSFSVIFVPLFSIIYVVFLLIVLFMRIEELPAVFKGFFSIKSIFNALKWSALKRAVTISFTKSIFSSESGLGSAGFSHSTTNNSPESQGLWGAVESLLDTIICTVTGMVLLLYWKEISTLGIDKMTSGMFAFALGKFGTIVYGISMAVFAFSSIICWYCIGQISLSYLTKKKLAGIIYLFSFLLCIIFSYVIDIDSIVTYSEVANGVMMIINLAAISTLIFKNSLTF